MISPCRDICDIDALSQLCSGCGRTLAEIASWSSLSDDERAAIMAQLPARMTNAGLPPSERAAPRSS
ncbi:MAG TPA: DUF1289 domain-containing protein [Xanthobacteraceae bacterium]|nr:DUF1289 domain-containing protein [Xanthobacteraceae bacterium]